VQDPQKSPVQGRTRWRRFAALLVPAGAVVGMFAVGIAHGDIPVSLAVSGQTFKVSASKLDGTGFEQYGGMASEKGANRANPADPKNHLVAVSAIDSAKLYDLCQSVRVPIPGMSVVLTINAGGNGNPALAEGLLIDMDSLKGDAVFENINIGRDATDLDEHAQAGSFGQSADTVVITDLKQVARSTSAGKFTLTGLDLKVTAGANAKECF
jgi:hypothetical protein